MLKVNYNTKQKPTECYEDILIPVPKHSHSDRMHHLIQQLMLTREIANDSIITITGNKMEVVPVDGPPECLLSATSIIEELVMDIQRINTEILDLLK